MTWWPMTWWRLALGPMTGVNASGTPVPAVRLTEPAAAGPAGATNPYLDGAHLRNGVAGSQAGTARGRVEPALELARRIGHLVPRPGSGDTLSRWELLATLGATDLTVARVVEPDIDARAILAEAAARPDVVTGAGRTVATGPPLTVTPTPRQTWGVFASEGPASTVRAAATGTSTDAGTSAGTGYRLDGVKPWCSLAGSLTHALITAAGPGGPQLFAVDLRHPGVRVLPVDWVARGLAEVSSGPIELDEVPASAVGGPGWYLDRPGFWWGGIGVAVGLARTAWAHVHRRQVTGRPSEIAAAQLGAIDIALQTTRVMLLESARLIDDPGTPPEVFPRLAQRVRAVAAATAENVLRDAGHLLGPAPLAFDEEHARRVADLTVYVRQQHAERDSAALGTSLAEDGHSPY